MPSSPASSAAGQTAGRTDLTPPQTAPRTTDWRITAVDGPDDGRLSQTISLADRAADVDSDGRSPDHAVPWPTALAASLVVQRRVDAAAQMLVSGRTSITEIALSCGFSSSQHFATAFRQIKGMTPSDWRQTAGLALAPQPTGGTRKNGRPCHRIGPHVRRGTGRIPPRQAGSCDRAAPGGLVARDPGDERPGVRVVRRIGIPLGSIASSGGFADRKQRRARGSQLKPDKLGGGQMSLRRAEDTAGRRHEQRLRSRASDRPKAQAVEPAIP